MGSRSFSIADLRALEEWSVVSCPLSGFAWASGSEAIDNPDSIGIRFPGSREHSPHPRLEDWKASFRFVLSREISVYSRFRFPVFAEKFYRALLRLFVAKFEKP